MEPWPLSLFRSVSERRSPTKATMPVGGDVTQHNFGHEFRPWAQFLPQLQLSLLTLTFHRAVRS